MEDLQDGKQDLTNWLTTCKLMANTQRLIYLSLHGDLLIQILLHKMLIQKNMLCLLENSQRQFLNTHKALRFTQLAIQWELPWLDRPSLVDKHQIAFSQNTKQEHQFQARLKPSSVQQEQIMGLLIALMPQAYLHVAQQMGSLHHLPIQQESINRLIEKVIRCIHIGLQTTILSNINVQLKAKTHAKFQEVTNQ